MFFPPTHILVQDLRGVQFARPKKRPRPIRESSAPIGIGHSKDIVSGTRTTVNDKPPADVELVISGISPSRDGQSERHRLEAPTRFKMFVAQTETAHYQIGDQPVLEQEFALALEMAKVRQLDRIADLLERVAAQFDERGRK